MWLPQSFILYSDQKPELLLYSTSACHLCEQAEVLLLKTLPANRFQLRKIDIALDEELMDRYGCAIPVLARVGKNAAQIELFWPFDENKIMHFLFVE